MNATLVSILAQIAAVQARIEGMKALNQQYALMNWPPGWTQEHFEFQAAELDRLADSARQCQ